MEAEVPSFFSFVQILCLIFFGLVVYVIFRVVNSLSEGIFDLDYAQIRAKFPNPMFSFSASVSAIDFVCLRGFYAMVFVYEDGIIVKFFGKAILVNDIGRISLGGALFSRLVIRSEDSKRTVTLALSPFAYKKMKEWLEHRRNIMQ